MNTELTKRFSFLLHSLISAGLALLALPAWADDSPMSLIENTYNQAKAVLEDPAYQGKEHSQRRIEKLEEILLPHIDRARIAESCLGPHWQTLTEEQRQQFIQLFTELIEQTYGGMLDRYPPGVRFSFDRQRIDGDYAEVDTQIFIPDQDQPNGVVYWLHQQGGQWLIYDVSIDNISMVSSYRDQFNRIIERSSYDELVKDIQNKLTQLQASPAS